MPAGEIGLVIAQVGAPLPVGAKSAVYKPEFSDFSDVAKFLDGGGEKGVQRPVLPPGTLAPIHPVAFLVIISDEVYGEPVSTELVGNSVGALGPESFGLSPTVSVSRRSARPRAGIRWGSSTPWMVIRYHDMLVIQQGEVAVIKSYVGLPTADTRGTDFEFGSIVEPGHQGIWSEPLRTGKYPLNPHCYGAVVFPRAS